MHKVFGAAHDDGVAIQVVENSAEVAVQLLAQRFVAQKRAALFCGEDGVHQNLCQGLRHDLRMSEARP